MRVVRTALTLGFLALPALAGAQSGLVPPPSWAAGDLVCAPFLTYALPNDSLRVIGSEDTVVKQMMGPGDTLVVSGGSQQGLQAGQEFFVRRLVRSYGELGPSRTSPLSVHTAAHIRIVGVGAEVSTATVTSACEGILLDDYLEPYDAPVVAETPIDGEPQFGGYGRVLVGDQSRLTGGTGDFMMIDLGSDHGIRRGQLFSVFRDKLDGAGPLVEIGTVEAVSVRPNSSTVQIRSARDAVRQDDLVAIRR